MSAMVHALGIALGPGASAPTDGGGFANMGNPASINCNKVGGESVTRTLANGDQLGVCVFKDGTECDEWALMRGDCHAPVAKAEATSTPATLSPWLVGAVALGLGLVIGAGAMHLSMSSK